MTVEYIKRNNRILPADNDSAKQVENFRNGLKEGERARVTFSKDYSTQQHRFLRSVIRAIVKGDHLPERFGKMNEDMFTDALKEQYCLIHPEYFVRVKRFDGTETLRTFSLSSSEIDQHTHNDFVQFVCDWIEKEIGVSANDILINENQIY